MKQKKEAPGKNWCFSLGLEKFIKLLYFLEMIYNLELIKINQEIQQSVIPHVWGIFFF